MYKEELRRPIPDACPGPRIASHFCLKKSCTRREKGGSSLVHLSKSTAMAILQTFKKHKAAFQVSAAVNIGSMLFGYDTGVAGAVVALAR